MMIRCDAKRLFYILTLGMAFAIPIVFNPFSFFRFEMDKILLFRLIVSVMLAWWLLDKGSLKNLWRWFCEKTATMNLFGVETLQLAFIGVYGLATIFSVAPAESFWGLVDRGFGFITVISLIIFYWLIRGVFVETKRVQALAMVVVGAGLIVGIYAILQKFGLEFIPGVNSETLSSDRSVLRPIATLGNPNYLGAYLAMILPFGLLLFDGAKQHWQKGLVLITIFVQLAALYFTLSRAGWLGTFAGMLFFLIFYIYKLPSKRGTIVVTAVALLSVVLFFSGLFGLGGDRRTQDLTFEGGSMYVRLQDFKYAVVKILERPLLGFGPETYMFLAMDRVYTEKELAIDDRLSDRVHNLFLDTLINVGIVGLLILITIFVQLFRRAWQGFFGVQESARRIVVLTASSALVAYLVQVQFHFDTIVTSFFVFICFALISDFAVESVDKTSPLLPRETTGPMALAAGVVFVVGAGWNVGEIVLNLILA